MVENEKFLGENTLTKIYPHAKLIKISPLSRTEETTNGQHSNNYFLGLEHLKTHIFLHHYNLHFTLYIHEGFDLSMKSQK